MSLESKSSFEPPADKQVLWEQADVCANLTDLDHEGEKKSGKQPWHLLPGKLSVVERKVGVMIDWEFVEEEMPDWVMTDSVSFSNGIGSGGSGVVEFGHSSKEGGGEGHPVPNGGSGAVATPASGMLSFSVELNDLKSFKMKHRKQRGRGEHNCTEIKFHCKDGTSCMPLLFRAQGSESFISCLQRFVSLKRSSKEIDLVLVSDLRAEQLEKSVNMLLTESSNDFLTRLLTRPTVTAWSGLGRVTNFVTDRLVPALLNFEDLNVDEQTDCVQVLKEQADEVERLHVNREDSFQVVSRPIELPTRPGVPRGPLLTAEVWRSRYLQSNGQLLHFGELRQAVFRGGVSKSIRVEVWKFILGYYKPDWDKTEQENYRKKKFDEYYRMKQQWKSMTEEQEENFSAFRDRKAIVEKDVQRTDRSHPFFEGDENAHLHMLYDILMTYCMYNFDLGYVQGMSDLLSPILVVMENEVDSFWCFVQFMKRVNRNFEMDQQFTKCQLMQLRDLLMVVNSRFLNYLEAHDSDNMFFCFRWILVLFKREFSIDDIMTLWERFLQWFAH